MGGSRQGGLGVTKNQGERNGNHTLTAQDVREIRILLEHGYTQRAIASAYSVTQPAIRDISTGRTWTTYLPKEFHASTERPSGPDDWEDDLPKVSQGAVRFDPLAAAGKHEQKAGRGKEDNPPRPVAWLAALPASFGGASDMSEDVPAVGKLLRQQHVPGQPRGPQAMAGTEDGAER